ncbi:MAG: histidinol-phosphatase [Acutalibacteraceae bacterium]
MKMKYNYHTHTSRCNHASGEDEEYVLCAIEAGYEEIGFSDHCPWPFQNYVSSIRMGADETEDYVNSIRLLKEKYKDKIRIKLGFECEYFVQYLDWMKELLEKYEFDYIILGHHYSSDEPNGIYNGFLTEPKEIEQYKNDVLHAMDSGLFSYVAHPDLYMRRYPAFDCAAEDAARQIIEKSNETKIPLEYNLLGIDHGKRDGRTGYPYPEFWKLAGEMGATAVIGIDAHDPKAYLDTQLHKQEEEKLKNWGVQLTDKIKFLR